MLVLRCLCVSYRPPRFSCSSSDARNPRKMSIHSSVRPLKHRNHSRNQVRQTSISVSSPNGASSCLGVSGIIDDDALTNQSTNSSCSGCSQESRDTYSCNCPITSHHRNNNGRHHQHRKHEYHHRASHSYSHHHHHHQQHRTSSSIGSNRGEYFDDSIQITSNATHSANTSSSPRSGNGQRFSQYMPTCLYMFHQETFPRNWCLKMISNPYPFHII